MRFHTIIPTAVGAISLFLTSASFGQGPVGDQVKVKFDQPVMVGSHTLQPGDYLVKQATSASNPRVLEFTNDNGTQLFCTVTAIPILQNIAPSETKVVLDDEAGGVARLRRIWVRGRNYGYEIPGNGAAATQVAASAGTLEGRYTAEAAPNAERAAEPAPTPQPRQEARAETPPPAPAPQPETPAPQPETPAPAPTPEKLPATALGWADLALAGLSMVTAGLLLYWRASRTAESR